MGFRHHRSAALLLSDIGGCLSAPAQAILDLSTSDRRALDITDRESCTGMARSPHRVHLPLGQDAYGDGTWHGARAVC